MKLLQKINYTLFFQTGILLFISLFPSLIISAQGTCCCGVAIELSFPNLDFEAPPAAPPGIWIDYFAGDNYSGWNINSGSVSIHHAGHLNLGAGNPNGSTQHMDLHGEALGSASYVLTGLTAGSRYTISFWYAIHSIGTNVSARLTVNGGSLLNVSWNASNHGNVIWFQTMYDFIADGSVATMEFTGTGATPCCGMLIDDIQIFECPGDSELPVVTNPPDDLEVECDKEVPAPPVLNISDNCDGNPKITLKEKKETFDPCTKKITRTWEIKDACGNVTLEDQIIDIIDRTPPVFTKSPEGKIVYCDQDVTNEFDDWIKKNGNAIALDNCGAVSWRTDYNHIPKKYCDTIITAFIAIDICGYESLAYANFIVLDSSAPKFLIQAQSKNLVCVPNFRDSLRIWLDSFGFSKTIMDCDTVILSHNFNGDSTQNPILVTFYANDRCGNIDSSKATFSYRSASDTFRITNYSCSFTQNSIDTIPYLSNGCDSIVILELIKLSPDSIYIQSNTCDPQQAGFDTLRLLNSSGCDSIVFNEYKLRPILVTGVQIMDCSYFKYFRDTLTLTGQYCDSIVIREYIPLRKDSITVQINTCDKTKEDTAILNLRNTDGCDSIVTLQTIYTGQQNTFLTKQECGILKNYTDTMIIQIGLCDSLVITTHIALPLDTIMIQSGSCDVSKVGLFSKTLSNRFGCDSLVIEKVLRLPSDSVFISNTTCTQSQAGASIQKFTNKFQCDSIVTTTSVFIPADTISVNLITCITAEVGVDTLTLTNARGCDSLIYSNTQFVAKQLVFQLDSITCIDKNDGRISILNASSFSNPLEIILNNTIINNPSLLKNLSEGSYTMLVRDQNGCISDTISFQLINPTAFTTELGPDLLLDPGQIIILNLNSNRFPQFIYWTPQGISSCTNCQQIEYTSQQEEWIYTLAIDERGCESRDSIFIRLKQSSKIFAPNVISNNGDNINDYFYLIGDDKIIIELLEIYDRWGERVFTTTNTSPNKPESGWNGIFNNQKLNPGVFAYYARVRHTSGVMEILKGDFTLIR